VTQIQHIIYIHNLEMFQRNFFPAYEEFCMITIE